MADTENRLVIAGGGLAGCLTALALARLRPEVPTLLVESAGHFGGNHVWSFFETDIRPEDRWLVESAVVATWRAYDVNFPKRRRIIDTAYNSASSARLDSLVRASLRPDQYRLNCPIESITPTEVLLAGGESIPAAATIDARGPVAAPGMDLGWQKFVGREYRLDQPHGLVRPIVMDATVDQSEGYRFVYCLPFSATHLLVEDTYYSLSASLDPATLGDRIEAYLASRGWHPAELLNEEQGVLPVAMGGDVAELWDDGTAVPKIGLRGGFFHPMTGYSLPDAVRTALLIASQPDLSGPALYETVRKEAARLWKQRGFYRLLGRMLFRAAPPPRRYAVLEHFYRLDAAVIARFYAGRSTLADKARILTGKPPVPIRPAIASILGAGR